MTVALPSPVEGVSSVEVYRVPVPDPRITLKLDTNEGPAPAPELRAILAELEREPINRYPNAGDLEADLAEMHGVAPAQVFVGAGLDDALMRLMIAYTGTGRRVLVTRPTFAMIPHYLGVTRAETVELDWWEGAYPIERASEAARDATIAFFVTPNNPTGLAAGADDLARLSAAMPGGLLVADLAYGEFADTDLLPVALGLPNVVTLRTFSKAWGMAGLRVGYAIGPEPVIEAVRKAGQPFSVPSSSLAVARAWLPHGADFARRTADRVRHERGVLAELLQ
ncbi:MAG: histidinol-phosphate transaminase, partial [Planctomycetota bacterium]